MSQHIFFFNSLSSNKNSLASCTSTDSNITQWNNLENDHNSSLSLKIQFNNDTPENSNNPEKISSSSNACFNELH